MQNLGMLYHKAGQYKKEEKLYKKAKRKFPNDPNLIENQAVLSLTKGDTSTANRYLNKLISIDRDSYTSSEASIKAGLVYIYSQAESLIKQRNITGKLFC